MLTQILVPAAIFTAIVVLLSGLVLFARRWLAPSGDVTLTLNENRQIVVAAGRRLLGALGDAGIYLPAACGGRGTCGQCRIRVLTGGGSLSPAEAAHIDARDAAAGYRLACMTRIRESMTVEVPADVLGAERRMFSVSSTRFVAPYLKEIVLASADGKPFAFRAGDYVVVEAPAGRRNLAEIDVDPAYRDRWQRDGIAKMPVGECAAQARAYSLGNAPGEGAGLKLVIRLALPPPSAPPGTPPGCVSTWLFGLAPGDAVPVSGPFGDFHATDSDAEMVFIGGGAGIAPLRALALEQLARARPRRMSFWYGARNQAEIGYALELAALAEKSPDFDFHIALSGPGIEPGWTGPTGFIHHVAREAYLRNHPAIGTLEFYLCGPPLMSAAVMQMLDGLGVDRQKIFLDDFGS